jgi:TldD protein
MIRDGELAEYVRDAALTGSTLDVLGRIDALGREVRFTDGTCGKNGQWVPVKTGGPFTRVRGVVVGGQ